MAYSEARVALPDELTELFEVLTLRDVPKNVLSLVLKIDVDAAEFVLDYQSSGRQEPFSTKPDWEDMVAKLPEDEWRWVAYHFFGSTLATSRNVHGEDFSKTVLVVWAPDGCSVAYRKLAQANQEKIKATLNGLDIMFKAVDKDDLRYEDIYFKVTGETLDPPKELLPTSPVIGISKGGLGGVKEGGSPFKGAKTKEWNRAVDESVQEPMGSTAAAAAAADNADPALAGVAAPKKKSAFRTLDIDGDGTLDLDEMLAIGMSEETFRLIDTDNSGTIEKKEFRTWAKANRAEATALMKGEAVKALAARGGN